MVFMIGAKSSKKLGVSYKLISAIEDASTRGFIEGGV